MLNNFFFIAFPYVAVVVFLIGVAYRYKVTPFTYSSLSSQFLEGSKLYWGALPFHIGILVIFLGHLVAFLVPGQLLLWNSSPVRLIVLEVSAFTFGLTVLVGIVLLLIRRFGNDRLIAVSSPMDVVLELTLLVQVFLGLWIAYGYRWGASWFAADLSPYLWSIVKFQPDIQAVVNLPLVIQAHIVLGFFILFIFPFTRLVHFLVAPLHYVTRPYQIVMWNWDRKSIRDPRSGWTRTRPRNN